MTEPGDIEDGIEYANSIGACINEARTMIGIALYRKGNNGEEKQFAHGAMKLEDAENLAYATLRKVDELRREMRARAGT